MSPIAGKLRDELVRAYAATERHYHNLTHIEAMLDLMRSYENALSDPAAVEAAIWFHDAVYDTHRHDNEERSAQLATDRLKELLSPDRLKLIVSMIRATAGHLVPDALGRDGRRKVLQSFLDRPAIYASPRFRASHETAARANLTRSLERLARP